MQEDHGRDKSHALHVAEVRAEKREDLHDVAQGRTVRSPVVEQAQGREGAGKIDINQEHGALPTDVARRVCQRFQE